MSSPASWSDPAFEAFVHRYSATLLHAGYLLTGDHGQAEDLLQVTLLRTARHWSSARRAPEAYSRRVLINLARDRHRGLGRRVRERPLEDHADALAADDQTGDVIDHEALMESLRALPARQREVIVLRFFADLTIADTAAAIGANEGTVKSHTRRALTRLKTLLGDTEVPLSEPTRRGV